MESGLVFNIQKYSLQDGPGIRTTVFLKGCPLCCAWCHNPEGQSAEPEIMLIENRCIGCGACRRACPFTQALDAAQPLPTRPEDCTLCGACVEACPTGARQMVGQPMTTEEAMKEVTKDEVFFEESQGGVTISGGEPLSQPAFLKELLAACRARGLHTAVDTCGFGCTDNLLEVAQLADLMLFDLKHMDDDAHRRYTGVSNRPILANLKALDEVHQNIWLRVPLIPGINDSRENLEAIARLAMSLAGVHKVTLLPYHRTGVGKFRRLGRECRLDGLEPPSPEQMHTAAAVFDSFGVPSTVGG